jgi:hypothetical protein
MDPLFEADGSRGGSSSWLTTAVILGAVVSLALLAPAFLHVRTVEGYGVGPPWIYLTTLGASIAFGVWSYRRNEARIRIVRDAGGGLRLVVSGPAVELDVALARGGARWVRFVPGPHVGAEDLVHYHVVLAGVDERLFGFWLLAGSRGTEPPDWPERGEGLGGCAEVFLCPGIVEMARVVLDEPPTAAAGPPPPARTTSKAPRLVAVAIAAAVLILRFYLHEEQRSLDSERVKQRFDEVVRERDRPEVPERSRREVDDTERTAARRFYEELIPPLFSWGKLPEGTSLVVNVEGEVGGARRVPTFASLGVIDEPPRVAVSSFMDDCTVTVAVPASASVDRLEERLHERTTCTHSGEHDDCRYVKELVHLDGRDVVRETWESKDKPLPVKTVLVWPGARAEVELVKGTAGR